MSVRHMYGMSEFHQGLLKRFHHGLTQGLLNVLFGLTDVYTYDDEDIRFLRSHKTIVFYLYGNIFKEFVGPRQME